MRYVCVSVFLFSSFAMMGKLFSFFKLRKQRQYWLSVRREGAKNGANQLAILRNGIRSLPF